MAVPTISSVSPNSGPAAGGNLVTVTGTNFKVPTVPYANPIPAAVPTVQVTVGSFVSPFVEVLSATSLRFRAPRYRHVDPRTDAYSALAVKVENLDAAGDPIAGESATKNSAYTYARWVLGAPQEDPPLYKIARELLWALKVEVERQTKQTTYIEYAEEGSETMVVLAELPSINLMVSTPLDPEYSWDNYWEDVDRGSGIHWLFKGVRTHMLEVNLYLAGRGTREASFLTAAVEEFVQVNPLLTVEGDATLAPGEDDEFPLEISREAMLISTPNDSAIVCYSMQLRVRGIPVLPTQPSEIVKEIQSFVLALSDYDITAPIEMDIT